MNSSISNIRQSVGGLNILKTGGTTSMKEKIMGVLNWKTILIVVLVVVLIYVAYNTYLTYINKSGFKANRENIPIGQTPTTTANLMLFYVDWCPHCKTAKPEWEALKAEYQNKSINGYKIIFTEHNCTEETAEVSQLMDKYNIEGYPTIKLIKDNQVIEYDAKPTKSTMEQFLNTVL